MLFGLGSSNRTIVAPRPALPLPTQPRLTSARATRGAATPTRPASAAGGRRRAPARSAGLAAGRPAATPISAYGTHELPSSTTPERRPGSAGRSPPRLGAPGLPADGPCVPPSL